MQVPRPDTLVSRTVETLRQSIQQGDIGPQLPGEPRLAKALGVARRTLRSALAILTREGWITESSRGCPRKVIPQAPAQPQTSAQTVAVLLPTPLDALSSGTQDFLRDLATRLSPDQVTLAPHYHNVYQLKKPQSRLQKIVEEHKADLWLLYEASIPIARFFKKNNIPTILCGGPVSDPELPYMAFNGIATLRHAIGVLSRAGHTRISAPIHYNRPGQIEAFQQEMESRSLPFSIEYNTPVWEHSSDQLFELLLPLLSSPDRPTAIIINGMDAVITLYSVLLKLGLSVPQDISLIISGSDPLFTHFKPQLSYYSTSHQQLANALAHMIRKHLRNPGTPPAKELLLMDYIPGKSVASPPGQ